MSPVEESPCLADWFRIHWLPVVLGEVRGPQQALLAPWVECVRWLLASNPSMLYQGDPRLGTSFMEMLLEPLLTKNSTHRVDEANEGPGRLRHTPLADALYELALTAVLMCHILATEHGPLEAHVGPAGSFDELLYHETFPALIEATSHSSVDLQPIDDGHRYQQQTLMKLLLDAYTRDERTLLTRRPTQSASLTISAMRGITAPTHRLTVNRSTSSPICSCYWSHSWIET